MDGCDSACVELFPLVIPVAERDELARVLSIDEQERGARFMSKAHGEHFVVAHGRLRKVLGSALRLAPEAIEFAPGPHGKPELCGAAAAAGLRFNLSHSGGLGLIGWSWRREIGVDVEVWRTTRDQAALVHRYFSAMENAAWEALPPNQRLEGFFNLWTRKEAYVKALGRGLALPLNSFDVSLENGPGARLLRTEGPAADGRKWCLASPVMEPGLSVAVVLEAGACDIFLQA